MPIRFITPSNAPDEWARMWEHLAAEPVNKGAGPAAICPTTGEYWQYMGTEDNEHVFRHRHHPVHKRRLVVKVPEVLA